MMGRTLIAMLAVVGVAARCSVAESWRDMADRLLRQPVHGCSNVLEQPVSGLDEDGYGNAAWSLAYAMEALNVMYEATGDPAYLRGGLRVARSLMDSRDSELAGRGDRERYMDYVRGRVMKAWGTGTYSGGRHTCWLVHQGMLLYPIAELCRLVRSGGKALAQHRAETTALERQVREVAQEFDTEWHEGPKKGMAYYVSPDGKVLPNNYQSAMGRVFLALGDRASRSRARKLLAYIRSKLTLDTERDCWLWAYSQRGPDGPAGIGEDISHAAITGSFLYLCWERRGGFSRRDVERLARTFTRAVHLGGGTMAGRLGVAGEGAPEYTAQCGRWAHLARIDPAVEDAIRMYIAAHPTTGALSGPTGALGFAYLARVEKVRR